MTPERLAEIRARAKAASPGPWWTSADEDVRPYDLDDAMRRLRDGYITLDDYYFVGKARTDIPELLDAIAEQDARIAFLEKALREAVEWAGPVVMQQIYGLDAQERPALAAWLEEEAKRGREATP